MPLIKSNLKSQILSHIDNLDSKTGSSAILRKLDFMNKFHTYASSIFPPTTLGTVAKLSGLAAFMGDKSDVNYSYQLALSKALSMYDKIISTGMIPNLYLQAYIPIDSLLHPQLLQLTPDKDKSDQADILSSAIDTWMKTGISNYTVPPSPPVPTKWM